MRVRMMMASVNFYHRRQRKSAALEVDTLCIQLVNCLTLNGIEKCLDLLVNNIVRCLTGRGILQNAEHRMSHFTPPITV